MTPDAPPSTISVVVPTRNRAQLIERALRSILGQTRPPDEIIVVDDASTDETRAVIDAIASPLVQTIRHVTRLGAAAARNAGIRGSQGEFIAFLDDDDEWLPNKLALQSAALAGASSATCAVYGGVHTVGAQSGRIASTWMPKREARELADFLASTDFMTSVPLIRRSALFEVGLFDEALPGGQDHDLWIRLSERYSFVPVHDVVARHFVHRDQITGDLALKVRSKQAILDKHRERFVRHPTAYAKQLERLGMLRCADRSFDRGRECFGESVRVDPTRESARRHLERSIADAEAHREFLLEQGFDRVDGVTRFY